MFKLHDPCPPTSHTTVNQDIKAKRGVILDNKQETEIQNNTPEDTARSKKRKGLFKRKKRKD